jgi:hypothetical protein
MKTAKPIYHLALLGSLLLGLLVLTAAVPPGAAGAQADAQQALLAKYPPLAEKLRKNQFGAPIYLQSTEAGGSSRVDLYGIIDHPFAAVEEALQSPPNWCDITPLHINIKACTYRKIGERWQLTLYSGRKFYQSPSEGFPLELTFRTLSLTPQFLDVALSAKQGPLRTRDHRMTLEAAPLDAVRSFVHFSYRYSYGAMARMAMKTYLNTLGRDKVGFSTTPGKGGKYYYIDGERGAIERNAVRYYLAVESYLDSLNYPEPRRFEHRLNEWYDLTAKYPRQLKEDEKGEYLAMKKKEHNNQLNLQSKEANQGG